MGWNCEGGEASSWGAVRRCELDIGGVEVTESPLSPVSEILQSRKWLKLVKVMKLRVVAGIMLYEFTCSRLWYAVFSRA